MTSKRRATMADVAADSGFSRSTVSLVVRDSPQIPEATKQRVRASMDRLGYIYNRAASSLRGSGQRLYGLLLTNARNPFFTEMIMSMHAGLDTADEMLLGTYSLGDPDRELRLLTALAERGVDGIIVFPSPDADLGALTERLDALRLPVVTLIRDCVPGAAHVSIDDVRAGELLGAHLATLGPRTVTLIGAPEASEVASNRAKGLRSALYDGAGPAPAIEVIHDPATGTERYAQHVAYDIMSRQLEDRPVPDALVCFNDAYALGAYQALRERGLRPGRDVAVASFDNIVGSGELVVPLTSVDTHPAETGRAALERLRALLDGRPATSAVIEPELHVRPSTTDWSPK